MAQKFLAADSAMQAERINMGQNPNLPVLVFFHEQGAVCELRSDLDNNVFNVLLAQLSLTMVRHIQASGGLLLHGALAEWNGAGVIFTGPGGGGKSTASKRLPSDWNSLSDDNTLVVRDASGKYWAHPWPTWSQFRNGGSGGTWNVEQAVPLAGIFYLHKSEVEKVSPIGTGQATALLIESNGQASRAMPHSTEDEMAAHRSQCFDSTCSLAASVPVYKLELSLTGPFWEVLENTIAAQG